MVTICLFKTWVVRESLPLISVILTVYRCILGGLLAACLWPVCHITERKKGAADPSAGVMIEPQVKDAACCLPLSFGCVSLSYVTERKKGAAEPSAGVKGDARDGRMTGKMWFIQQLAAGENSHHYRLHAMNTPMYMPMGIVHAHVQCAKEEGTGALGVNGARGWAHHRQAVVHSAVGSR